MSKKKIKGYYWIGGNFYRTTKDLVVWKKARLASPALREKDYSKAQSLGFCLVKLVLPRGTTFRMNPVCGWGDSKKCRATRARVVRVEDFSGYRIRKNAYSDYCDWLRGRQSGTAVYRPGTVVRPKERFSREDIACASGIHFFLDKLDAISYTL